MSEVIFSGSVGRLEGRFRTGPTPASPIAIVLHHHPKYGGSMHSKVVYTLNRCFVDQGFSVLRFNFRGVGRSEGSYDNGEGELSDAAAALDWLQNAYPKVSRFWVAGFSFGAWIGMQLLMRRPEMEGFISISPPANTHDFNFLAPCPVSGQVQQGALDSVVTVASVDALVHKIRNQKGIHIDYHVVEGADHFFTSHQGELAKNVHKYLDSRFVHYGQKMAG